MMHFADALFAFSTALSTVHPALCLVQPAMFTFSGKCREFAAEARWNLFVVAFCSSQKMSLSHDAGVFHQKSKKDAIFNQNA